MREGWWGSVELEEDQVTIEDQVIESFGVRSFPEFSHFQKPSSQSGHIE